MIVLLIDNNSEFVWLISLIDNDNSGFRLSFGNTVKVNKKGVSNSEIKSFGLWCKIIGLDNWVDADDGGMKPISWVLCATASPTISKVSFNSV